MVHPYAGSLGKLRGDPLLQAPHFPFFFSKHSFLNLTHILFKQIKNKEKLHALAFISPLPTSENKMAAGRYFNLLS